VQGRRRAAVDRHGRGVDAQHQRQGSSPRGPGPGARPATIDTAARRCPAPGGRLVTTGPAVEADERHGAGDVPRVDAQHQGQGSSPGGRPLKLTSAGDVPRVDAQHQGQNSSPGGKTRHQGAKLVTRGQNSSPRGPGPGARPATIDTAAGRCPAPRGRPLKLTSATGPAVEADERHGAGSSPGRRPRVDAPDLVQGSSPGGDDRHGRGRCPAPGARLVTTGDGR
jgi:hypothetical protein